MSFHFETIVKENILLSNHSTYEIGGEAKYFASPENLEELVFLIDSCTKKGLKYYIFGNGANILFPDNPDKEIIFITLKKFIDLKLSKEGIHVSSGIPLSFLSIIGYLLQNESLYFTYLLPGSVGAGIYMNARCYESEISQIVSNIYYIDLEEKSSEVKKILPLDCCFGYKSSIFQKKKWIITGVDININYDKEKIFDNNLLNKIKDKSSSLSNLKEFYSFFKNISESLMKEKFSEKFLKIEEDRNLKRHFDYPSCGSVFKNNRSFGSPMGIIIERLGLKGKSHGRAMISPYHGNIIINRGGAKARDIIYLIKTIEETVYKHYNILPEREIIVI